MKQTKVQFSMNLVSLPLKILVFSVKPVFEIIMRLIYITITHCQAIWENAK